MQVGKNTHIDENVFIKHKDTFVAGDYCNVLSNTMISPHTTLGNHCLIDRFVLIAGSNYKFTMEDFSGLGGGVRIWLQSNDYTNSLISTKAQVTGDVTMKKYSGIGCNSVIMPNNIIPEGTVVGANSFVPPNFPFEEWSVYVGNPIRKIKDRNKESVMAEVAEFLKEYK